MACLVLADASPLIGLARVDGLRWLPPLFGTVWLPTEVHAEVVSGFGSPAVIGMARLKGLIPSAKNVFALLHASDFRISAAAIRTILERVGEAFTDP